MKYQDTWIKGKLIEKGKMECESRYETIKNFCKENLYEGFTVMDIGANMAYFSIRLIEDFNAKSFAYEFNDFKAREKIINKNKSKNIMYINRKIQLNDLYLMSGVVKYDLILALSVLHHVSEPLDKWISALRNISKYTIIELASIDSKRYSKAKHSKKHKDYETIGYGDSHLKSNFKREIIAYKNI